MPTKLKRVLQWATGLLLSFLIAYVVGFGAFFLRRQVRAARPMGVFWEAWDHIDEYYYDDPPTAQARTYGAIRTSLDLLDDPYTTFVEPQPRALEKDRMRGSFGGIGVDLWRDPQGRIQLSPHPESPAEGAGIEDGDRLLAVEDQPVANLTVEEAQMLLRGEIGTEVAITVARADSDGSETIVVRRAQINIPSVTWFWIDRMARIGYVRVNTFTERTATEVGSALGDLRQSGAVAGLVLDLRENYGGLINPAVDTASIFLPQGVAVAHERSRGESASSKTYAAGAESATFGAPLAVLVNHSTASAAEIVAGALQDHERAPLIGRQTYGKGSVQLIFDLSDGSSVHVTSAVWLTPDEHQINGIGLTPDIEVLSDADQSVDEPLEQAIDYLEAKLTESSEREPDE